MVRGILAGLALLLSCAATESALAQDVCAVEQLAPVTGKFNFKAETAYGAQQRRYRALAAYWAPVISQDTDDSFAKGDYITKFSFDGDVLANNNWDNLPGFSAKPYVYYWVIEAENRYFVGYAFFHPQDWIENNIAGQTHENDLEGVVMSIRKDSNLPNGVFEGLVAEAHGSQYSFADDDTPPHYDRYAEISDSQNLTGETEDLDFVVDKFGVHPVVYSQAKGHGVYAHPLKTKGSWHFVTDYIPIFISNKVTYWPTLDWHGVRSAGALGIVSEDDAEKNWGDGITYHYEGEIDTPDTGTTADFSVFGYDLLSIRSLWDCRKDRRVFASDGGDFDAKDQPGGANAPWNWNTGRSFFIDPAALLDEKLSGWIVTATPSCSYVGNSFGYVGGGCPSL